MLSIVIPCFNEEEAIPVYYQEMKKIMQQMRSVKMELVFVDDGSTDRTLPVLKELSKKDSRCKYLSFSRNFGKEAAIYAGMLHAEGSFVALMDVDLQDPPSLIPEMYHRLQKEDVDCVATKRSDRAGEPRIRSWLSEIFYNVLNKISRTGVVRGARDYRMMKRKMVDAVLSMSESNRFSKGIFQWVGFRTEWMEFHNVERCAGKTKWNLWKLFAYALEGIVGFSVTPLYLASIIGSGFCGISVLLAIGIFLKVLIFNGTAAGWMILICVIFLVGGIQLLCTGILGQYLSRTYLESKHRPIYILKESSMEDGHVSEDKKLVVG